MLLATANVPESQVTAALDEAAGAGVVVRDAAREGHFTFTHALLADAITRDLPERQRQRIHEVAARLLELRAPSSVDAIAEHYHAAGLDTDAYRYALLAAERAAAAFTHDAALDALQVAQRHAPSARNLAELRVRLATTAFEAGRYAPAETWCDLALEWMGEGETHDAALAVRNLRERIRVHRGKPPLRAIEELRALLVDSPGSDATMRAGVQLAASALAASVADWPLTTTLARKAIEIAGDRGALAQRAEAHRLLALGRYDAAPGEAFAFAREAVADGTAAGDRATTALARLTLGELHLRAGHLPHAEASLGEALDAARAAHSAPLAAGVSRALGELRARQGNFGEATQWLGDAERIFTALGDTSEQLRTTLVAAHSAREQGERDRAHALYDVAAGSARTDIAWAMTGSPAPRSPTVAPTRRRHTCAGSGPTS